MFFLIGFNFLLVKLVSAQTQCPITAACTPSSAPVSAATFGMGIYRVQLAAIDTSTNGSIDGYRDYSCQRRASLLQGSSYTLTVRTGASAAENAVAWIDYDNNGTFAASERILYSLNAYTHTVSFTVPVTATLGQSLRLRIAADYVNSAIPTACSTPQYSQTEDYRVRIAAGNARPVARFSSADTVTCSGAVAFRDASLNTPTAWRWQFGDGSTSTQQHPTHTYAAAGTYAVRLRVCNAGGCDSLARPAYVMVRTDGPRAMSCQPATMAYCCQFGITRVRLAGLDHRSADGQAGYEDFSCASRATLTANQPYTLQLTTGPSAHDVRVYLDLNDDGLFTAPAELVYQGLAVLSPSVPFSLASTLNPVYNRALRLRIVADAAGSPAAGPCGAVQSGQAEDYAVTVLPNAAPPHAAFTLQYQQLCGPVQVTFANATTGGATGYAWDFGDGSTASVANPPAHTYAAPGAYPVRLVVQNAFGRDTARQRVAVATACPPYCTASGYGGTLDAPAYFTSFQVASIDNPDARGPGVGYRDFTSRYATVQAGQTYPVRATSLPCAFCASGPWAAVEIWVDFNQDGQFSPSELTGPLTQLSPHQLNLRIPANAKAGATRLRAIIHGASYQNQGPDPCPPFFLPGSVEDYTLVILPPAVVPRTGFYADLPAACNGLVQFRDTSWAAPSSWQWTFGDGSTATAQHPLHQYAAPGTYAVALRASNTYGGQTLTRPAYVTVSALAAGPRPAACLPSPVFGLTRAQHGIDTLRIGTGFFYHQPQNSPGYRDETCTRSPLALAQGTNYRVRFVDSNQADTGCVIWLDANNNGAFEAPGELVYSSLARPGVPGPLPNQLSVPVATVPNVPLRMRVTQWNYPPFAPVITVPSPCHRNEEAGQVRDFAVVVTPVLATVAARRADAWRVAPNPSTGLVTVYGYFGQPTPVEVWDLAGRTVYRATVVPTTRQQLELDLRTLPRGIYLLQLNHAMEPARLLLE